MILDFILYALAAYFVYKVIFGLIIPVFRTTQKVRQQFGNMQQHMQDQMKAAQNQNGYTNPPPNRPKPEQNKSSKAGDYIDFEEVK
jgi:Domain of unknown function (DUF4834)